MSDITISRRERKKKEQKANILRISRRLFEKNGFENTSIEEIAGIADISKPTFFNYFANKDSLIISMAEEEAEDIFLYAQELKDKKGAIEIIRLVLDRLILDAVKYLHLSGRVTFLSLINSNEDQSYIHTTYNQLWKDLVETGQASQEITEEYTSEDIATLIRGCYYSNLFKCFETGNTENVVADLNCSLNILFHGIAGKQYNTQD